jgi:hypothetical protein
VSAALVTPTIVLGKVKDAGLKLTAAAVPVPDTGTLWGLPAALSVNTIADVRAPVDPGVKTTETVQVPPDGATDAQPVGVGTKSVALVPADTIEVIVRTEEPEFVMVMTCGVEGVPTAWDAKVRLVGDGEKLAFGATPVPVRGTVCGLAEALSVTMTLAVRTPVALGVNITEMVQEPPATTLVPQVFVSV